MDSVTAAWNLFLVWPIEGALLYLTSLTTNAGLAIILFTILVRTLLLPLGFQQIRSQRAMMDLQPRMRELQRRWANDRQRLAQEQMRLYREAGVNPLAGCLPMVFQMPIWFALYSALINLSHNVESFQASFLWIPNLAKPSIPTPENPSTWALLVLPILTAATQWVVQKMSTLPAADPQQQQMSRMMEFMPIMFFIFSLQVGAGLTLYWVVSNLYSIVQQRLLVGWGALPVLGSPAPTPSADDQRPGAAPARPANPPRRSASKSRRRRGK